jgi:hypothetical protein
MNPTKNVVLSLFYASEQANSSQMWANSVFHLSRLPFSPSSSWGWSGGKADVSTEQCKSPFMAKMQPFVCKLLASMTSEHFLFELKDVAFCM